MSGMKLELSENHFKHDDFIEDNEGHLRYRRKIRQIRHIKWYIDEDQEKAILMKSVSVLIWD